MLALQKENRIPLLIAEDDPQWRSLLVRQLGGDAVVVAAANGEEALNFFARAPVDVLLTDMFMPGLDGLQLLSIVKDTDPSCDVILMSAHAGMSEVIEALNGGAAYFFEKTRPIEELIRVVERARSRHRVEQRTRDLAEGLLQTSNTLLQKDRNGAAELPSPSQLCEAVLQALPEPIAVVERAGRVVFANRAFDALLQLAPGQAAGRSLGRHLRAPGLRAALQATESGDLAVEAPDGTRLQASLLPADGGLMVVRLPLR